MSVCSAEEEQFEFLSFVTKFEKKYDTVGELARLSIRSSCVNSACSCAADFFHRFNAFRVELNEVRQHNAKNLE